MGAWTQAADPRVPSILVPRRRAHLRASQRERLLAAMAELAGRDGYGGVTVAQVIARAGVSRATFYECFGDREECLLAALGPIHERLLGEVCEAASGAPAGHVAAAVVRALSAFAASHPTQARLALSESLGARDRALQARDRLVAAIAAVIDEAYEAAPAATRAADLPSAVLVGGVCRVLGARVSRAEPLERGLADELTAWLGCYELPLARHRWRELRPLWAPARSPFLPPGRLRAPRRGAAGRRRLHDGRVGEAQRLRIAFATAELVRHEGYEAATVAAIASAAGVDTGVFYRHFAGKREALGAAGELLFGHLMAVAAAAFAAGESWPERVWSAAAAFLQCAQQNTTLAGMLLVDSHAAGAETATRAREFAAAFTIFLEEGFREDTCGAGPSAVALEAVAALVFELGYGLARGDRGEELGGLQPHLVFFVLAPFLGAAQANRFLRGHVPAAADVLAAR